MKPASLKQPSLQQAILQDADSCVMCGMCLPVCPTYQHYRHEAESPRGRIAAMQAMATQRIAPDAASHEHLDHCLGCNACEAMCPSQVNYSRLYENTQAMIAADNNRHQPWLLNLLLRQLSHPGSLNRYAFVLQHYQHSGMPKLAAGILRRNSLLQRGHQLLRVAKPGMLKKFYPAFGEVTGNVALFTGCMGSSFDAETQHSSIKLLNHLGYNVFIPRTQSCCGALHLQQGQADIAGKLSHHNQQVISALPVSHLIYTAPACGGQVMRAGLSVPATGIENFLLAAPGWKKLRFNPLASTAILHQSCSTLNKLKTPAASDLLLAAIPQLQLTRLQPAGCCGAGGSHSLLYPDLADALLEPKLNFLRDHNAHYLLSDNMGCSLHWRNGLLQAGLNIEVIHPVTLLARQLIH